MRSQLVQFRVTDAEFEDLQLAASKSGRSPHTHARELLRKRIDAATDSAPALKDIQRAIAGLAAARPHEALRADIERLQSALANATLLILHALGLEDAEANRLVNEHVRKKVRDSLPRSSG